MSYEIPYDWKFNANFSDVDVIPGLATSSGNNTFSGDINNATVTDPTTSSSGILSTALSNINTNIFRPGADIWITDSTSSTISYGYTATAGSVPPTWSVLTLSPSSFSINPVSSPNTNYLNFSVSNAADTPEFSSNIYYGKNISSNITQEQSGINFYYKPNSTDFSNIGIGYNGKINISTSGYISMSTAKLSSTYTTDENVTSGNMIFDDTDGIIYRCTNSTSTTSGSTTTYSNTWDKYYSTPSMPIYNGTNYIDQIDDLILSFTSDGTSSGQVNCNYDFNGNGVIVTGPSFSSNTMYSYNGITMSESDSNIQGSAQLSVSGGLNLTGSNGSGNSYNFVANINSILISTTNSGSNSSLSFTGGQFNLSSASTTLSSNSTTIISSNSTTVLTGSQIILSPSNGLVLYSSVPTSPTDTVTSGTFAPADDCLYIKGSTWSRFSQDPDWQIGMVPYVTSTTATSTSGTAGTTSIATETTSGYYIITAKVVGKCATSGLSCFAIFENYGTCFDGTNLTLSEGESTIHTFGSMSAYNVDMTVSGKNIVFTYNVTTSASTSWTWNIAVQQKFVTAY